MHNAVTPQFKNSVYCGPVHSSITILALEKTIQKDCSTFPKFAA